MTVPTVTIYGIRNCDTMKKARAWLDEHGVAYVFHDYKMVGIDAPRLEAWASEVGWEVLLNRAGTTFRKLPEKDKSGVDGEEGGRPDAGRAFNDQAAGARRSTGGSSSASSRKSMSACCQSPAAGPIRADDGGSLASLAGVSGRR